MVPYLLPIVLPLLGLAPAQAALSDPVRASRLAPLGAKPESTVVAADEHPRSLEVKFIDATRVRLAGGRFHGLSPELRAIDLYLGTVGATPERVFTQSDEWLTAWRRAGEERSGRALHDLTLFYRIELPGDGLVAEVCDALNAFEMVELAYPLPSVSDPIAPAQVGLGPTTPDFSGQQGYRGIAPTGIDADFGNTFSGGAGAGITIVDVEQGWTDDHEDIAHKAQGNYIGLPKTFYPSDHGTAVVGQLVGEHNGLGVRGLCYQADMLLSTNQGTVAGNTTAIMSAAAELDPGDVIVFEAQCASALPSPFPCEHIASTFAAIQSATANGIHVFSAGGNGGHDLDQPAYGGLFDRNVRDSGAVMVGASSGSGLNAASFSNFGSRMDAHGWGNNVTTCGFGDLHDTGIQETYTAIFSGTSSATPIVAAAGVILNGIHRSVFGTTLEPLVMRDLLVQTGTPQGAGGNIGPRPNVRAAIQTLDLPRISIGGSLVPGGDFQVRTQGPTGALFMLFFSGSIRQLPFEKPWGQLFLAPPVTRVKVGVLTTGSDAFPQQIPDDPGLSGTTLGYFQVWQRFPRPSGLTAAFPWEQGGQPGPAPASGGFGNYAAVEIQ